MTFLAQTLFRLLNRNDVTDGPAGAALLGTVALACSLPCNACLAGALRALARSDAPRAPADPVFDSLDAFIECLLIRMVQLRSPELLLAVGRLASLSRLMRAVLFRRGVSAAIRELLAAPGVDFMRMRGVVEEACGPNGLRIFVPAAAGGTQCRYLLLDGVTAADVDDLDGAAAADPSVSASASASASTSASASASASASVPAPASRSSSGSSAGAGASGLDVDLLVDFLRWSEVIPNPGPQATSIVEKVVARLSRALPAELNETRVSEALLIAIAALLGANVGDESYASIADGAAGILARIIDASTDRALAADKIIERMGLDFLANAVARFSAAEPLPIARLPLRYSALRLAHKLVEHAPRGRTTMIEQYVVNIFLRMMPLIGSGDADAATALAELLRLPKLKGALLRHQDDADRGAHQLRINFKRQLMTYPGKTGPIYEDLLRLRDECGLSFNFDDFGELTKCFADVPGRGIVDISFLRPYYLRPEVLGEAVERVRLGGGAFGDAYKTTLKRATDGSLVNVIIKKAASSEKCHQLLQEASILAELNGRFATGRGAEGFVKLEGVTFDADGTPLLVLEHLDGNLDELAGAGSQTEDVPAKRHRVELLLWLAIAVNKMHAAGILHGDLKLENALYQLKTSPGARPPRVAAAKLCDFGCAARFADAPAAGRAPLHARDTDELRRAVKGGTMEAWPPEILAAASSGASFLPTPEVDVYAFAILASAMLRGNSPYGGHEKLSVFQACANDSPLPGESAGAAQARLREAMRQWLALLVGGSGGRPGSAAAATRGGGGGGGRVPHVHVLAKDSAVTDSRVRKLVRKNRRPTPKGT